MQESDNWQKKEDLGKQHCDHEIMLSFDLKVNLD